jgi:hypothetical protein
MIEVEEHAYMTATIVPEASNASRTPLFAFQCGIRLTREVVHATSASSRDDLRALGIPSPKQIVVAKNN